MDFLGSLDLACQQHFLKLFEVLMASKVTPDDLARFDAGLGKLSGAHKQVEHLIAAHYQQGMPTVSPRDHS